MPSSNYTGHSYKTWQLKGVPGAELIRGSGYLGLYRVYNEHLAINLQEGGAVTSRFHGVEENHGPGDLALFPPDSFSTWDSHFGAFTFVTFPSEAFQEAVSRLGGDRAAPRFPALHISDDTIRQKLRRLREMVETSASALETADRLFDLLERAIVLSSGVAPSPADPTREHREIKLARDYLRENYAKTVSLDELAEYTGLSGFYLCRTFRDIVGLPPHAYQNYVRVKSAQRLLARGQTPSEVATAVGFYDQSHFCAHFKKWVHVTPGAYRQNHVEA